ncbi:hypothetical protein SAMN05421684_2047 [Asanoa ishikariensis]|uniref:Transmembrane protein n=1 Tax=Asanoa ishikariensis TaxID=137265 RepID=A0A1H3NGD1_9ACTN|nr:hypothetical protein [Asanoa ishikariensis]SDY87793.1 hypothetical protein SAMN05421684_2047 [Asanoa ishikariensis]
MKIYADRFPRFLLQVLTDLFVIAWVYFWIRGALWLQDQVQKLGVPGQKLEGAGSALAENLAEASSKVGRVPLVGDELTAPFEKAAGAARSVAEAGQSQQDVVGDLALALAVITAVLPILFVLLFWLPLRVRWVRRASAASRVRKSAAGRDLLALRALATQPLSKLAKLGPDVAESWRRSDDSTVEALAALELKSLGLRQR